MAGPQGLRSRLMGMGGADPKGGTSMVRKALITLLLAAVIVPAAQAGNGNGKAKPLDPTAAQALASTPTYSLGTTLRSIAKDAAALAASLSRWSTDLAGRRVCHAAGRDCCVDRLCSMGQRLGLGYLAVRPTGLRPHVLLRRGRRPHHVPIDDGQRPAERSAVLSRATIGSSRAASVTSGWSCMHRHAFRARPSYPG